MGQAKFFESSELVKFFEHQIDTPCISLQRQVIDHKSGQIWTGAGEVTLSATGSHTPQNFHLLETGQLRCSGQTVVFRQAYILKCTPFGGIEVYHTPEEQLFFRYQPTVTRFVQHQCGEDSYRGEIESTIDGINLKWEVIGPNKCYDMASHYAINPSLKPAAMLQQPAASAYS